MILGIPYRLYFGNLFLVYAQGRNMRLSLDKCKIYC